MGICLLQRETVTQYWGLGLLSFAERQWTVEGCGSTVKLSVTAACQCVWGGVSMDLLVFILKDLGPGLALVGGGGVVHRPGQQFVRCCLLVLLCYYAWRVRAAWALLRQLCTFVHTPETDSAALTGSMPPGYGFTCCCDVRL